MKAFSVFLYFLIRDYVKIGDVEKVLKLTKTYMNGDYQFTNEHLAKYAEEIAAKLNNTQELQSVSVEESKDIVAEMLAAGDLPEEDAKRLLEDLAEMEQ